MILPAMVKADRKVKIKKTKKVGILTLEKKKIVATEAFVVDKRSLKIEEPKNTAARNICYINTVTSSLYWEFQNFYILPPSRHFNF